MPKRKKAKVRRIGIMIGSDSDLPQCLEGFNILKEAEAKGQAKVLVVITNSIHRNTEETLRNLRAMTEPQNEGSDAWIEVWIVGAGWANHLTGMIDSYLRYTLKNTKTSVIGVAFENPDPVKNQAAILSITEVPGNQVIFDPSRHLGQAGFTNACVDAVYAELPALKLPSPKSVAVRTLDMAIDAAQDMIKK
jgi:phosphoribosylcarboxyaminoimidazole (NCAIR) mutase